MSRTSNSKIKGIHKNGNRWLIFHNKNYCKELSDDTLELVRVPDKGTIGFIEKNFYNVRECLKFINNWGDSK